MGINRGKRMKKEGIMSHFWRLQRSNLSVQSHVTSQVGLQLTVLKFNSLAIFQSLDQTFSHAYDKLREFSMLKVASRFTLKMKIGIIRLTDVLELTCGNTTHADNV
jgi:hypothetical protein